MRVTLRVDAAVAIGTGHVRRCLALADALRDLGADVRFVSRDLGLDVAALVSAHGHPLHLLPAPTGPAPASAVPHAAWAGVDAELDARDTIAAGPADWIVVDHYGFDAVWHRAASAAGGARICVVDDLADRLLAADLIVDQNFHPDHRAKYAEVARDVALLGGPRFALLGRAYADAPRHCPRAQAQSIGLFMGGVDPDDVTGLVLGALEGIACAVEVATTSGNPHLFALRRRSGIDLSVDLPDLAAFFAQHDLQIGAGGGATWERCCIGAPTLLLPIAENQLAVVPHLHALGAVITCPLDPTAIRAEVDALLADRERRRRLSETARALSDGLGAHRVALRLLRDKLAVRPVTLADGALMHAWRNHPTTRAVSRNVDAIPLEGHVTWLASALADLACTLLIAEVGGTPVGVIRFDRLGHGCAEVSLYLDPALHGLGLGTSMLLAGEARLSGLDIVAHVLNGNEASARMFAAAGYRPYGSGKWIKPADAPERKVM